MILVGDNGKVRITMILHGKVSPERHSRETAMLAYRVDQLSPHPKSMEYQRALEEDKE